MIYNTVMNIRTADIEDAAALLQIYKPYIEETAITFETEVPSLEDFTQRIAKTLQRYPWIVIEEEGKILGYAYTSAFKGRAAYDWSAETSIYVAMDQKGKGLGRKLYEELEKVSKRQGIENLYACIAYPIGEDPYLDTSSVSFHEHLGFAKKAHFEKCAYKFSRWYDMVWYGIDLGDHEIPQPFVPFPEL